MIWENTVLGEVLYYVDPAALALVGGTANIFKTVARFGLCGVYCLQ